MTDDDIFETFIFIHGPPREMPWGDRMRHMALFQQYLVEINVERSVPIFYGRLIDYWLKNS